MITLWPAFLCWVTRSPSPPTTKTSIKTTSSSCISSPTSTTSDQRVNIRLRGTEVPQLLFCSCFCCVKKAFFRPHTGGWRSSAAPQSHQVAVVSWTAKSPIPSEICGVCSTFLLFHICTCVHAHFELFNALIGLDCIFNSKPLFKDVILYCFLTVQPLPIFRFYSLVVFTLRIQQFWDFCFLLLCSTLATLSSFCSPKRKLLLWKCPLTSVPYWFVSMIRRFWRIYVVPKDFKIG